MKTISITQAYNLLKDVRVVIVNPNTTNGLCYPSVYEPNRSENPHPDMNRDFLGLTWIDNDGKECFGQFTEDDNQTVEVTDNGTLIVVDSEGEKFELLLLNVVRMNLDPKVLEIGVTHPTIDVDYYLWLDTIKPGTTEHTFMVAHTETFQDFHAIAQWVWGKSRMTLKQKATPKA